MFNSKQDKTQFVNLNNTSIPSSPTQTESSKKRMFARKPAYGVCNLPSEKKKILFQDFTNTTNISKNSVEPLRKSKVFEDITLQGKDSSQAIKELDNKVS